MARKTIEELDFKLILDDKKFNRQIQDDMAAAKTLNKSLSDILSMRRQINGVSQQDVANHRRALQMQKDKVKYSEMESREQIKTAAAQERLNQLRERGNRQQMTHNRLLNEARDIALSYASIWGAKKLVSSIIETTAEFELQRTTLAAMLQDVERANQIFEQIKAFSVMSPFSFKELATYAKQLAAYSIPVGELYDTTKMLADVSAGLGVGMDRLVLAYGQVRSAAFLRGQEVRQFTESGIPILEELRKQFVALGEEGITTADVFDKISKRLVPFEMVDKVFKDLTSEGGKFYRMQEVQSETLKGKISNLKDAYMIMFNEIGTSNEGLLKGGVDVVRKLAENYEKVGRALVALVAAYGGYRATLALVRLAETALIQAQLGRVSIVKGLTAAIEILIKKSKAYAAVMKLIANFNPWVAIGTAVIGLSAYFITASAQAAKFRRELEGIAQTKFNEAEKSVDTFRKLTEQIKNSTVGSQNYRDAISDLNRQYGEYLPNLLNEKNALTEILNIENEVTNAIYARAKAYASQDGEQKIIDKYGKAEEKAANALRNQLLNFRLDNGKQIGEDVAAEFIKGFKSTIKDDGRDSFEVFNEYADTFFGRTFLKTSFGSEVRNYVDAVRTIKGAYIDFQNSLDLLYNGNRYSSIAEMNVVEPIERAYDEALNKLRNAKLPAEEFAEQMKGLQLTKLTQLKDAFAALNEEARKAGKEGSWANKIKEIQEQIDALKPKDLGWLQKIVNPLVTGKGNNDLRVQEDTGYEDYLDNLRKEYKAVTEAYKDSNATYNKLVSDKQKGISVDDIILAKAKEQNDLYQQRKIVIEKIGAALGITVDDKIKKPKGKSEAQKALEDRIDLLKKLQNAYESLSEYVSDDKMPQLLSKFISASTIKDKDKIIEGLNFREELIKAAVELEKYDTNAAERLRSYLGYDEVTEQVRSYKELAKAQKDAQKAKKALDDYMRSWNIGDETDGEGVVFKITKIVSDYQKALDGLNDKRDEANEKLDEWIKSEKNAGEVVSQTVIQEKRDAITKNFLISKTNLLNKATEDVRKTAEEYVKEWAKIEGIDLSNFSQKTIFELNRIKAALDNFDASNLPDEIKAALEKAGIDIEAFIKAINLSVDSTKTQVDKLTDEEKLELLIRGFKELSSLFRGIASYADVAGNSKLMAMANGISNSLSMMSDVADGLSKGDYLGAVVSYVESIANAFLEAASNAAQLERNIIKGKAAADSLRTSLALSKDTDYIFGEDNLQKITNAWEIAADKFNAASEDIARSKEKLFGGSENDSNGWGATAGAASGAALGFYLGTIVPGIGNAVGAAGGAIVGAIVGLIGGALTDIALETDNFAKSLEEMAAELHAPLFDEKTGLFNVDTLQLILDTYSTLDGTSKAIIEGMIARVQDFEKTIEQLSEGMEGIFGDIAEDIASKFISAFKESGEAALDYRDTLDDVATSLAQMVIKSALLKKVFDDDLAMEIAAKVASGQVDGALALFEGALSKAEELAPYFQTFLDGISKYMQPESDSGDSVASGIKNITEDTANLLASYLNAIRADVSYSKVQRDQILNEVKSLASYVSSPTLMDYLNRIQANTFNTAEHTRDILSDLRSMMTTDGGEVALRDYQ